MPLWPQEFEELREEARNMAVVIRQAFAAGGEPSADRDERVAGQRKVLAALEVTSPAGTDEEVAGVPCRVFRCSGDARGTYVHFHGGAMMLGSPRMNDTANAALCEKHRITVISVDYRLAPEHPFPAAPDDCFAALRWVAAEAEALGFDGARIAVGGDSAGGNLAAVTAQRALHEDGPQLTYQVLIYPVVDLASTMEEHRYPSLLENAEGYYLDAVTMEAFQSWYVPDPADRTNPLASPILAPSLAGLPPALVLTCEYDPLRDEGEAYAKALADVGVDVTLTRYDGGIHGVFSMSQITLIGRRCMDEVVAGLRAAFG
jgi:acetyl esterase